MIFYLITSILCMGLLLLFYHHVLEKEKMLHINRGFLLFSLLFSLVIPIVPVGIADQVPGWIQQQFDVQKSIEQSHSSSGAEYLPPEVEYVTPAEVQEANRSSAFSWPILFLTVYVIISTLLAARLIRIIHMIQLKAKRNPRKLYQGCELVLLNDKVVPHTFMNTIFVNRQEYESGGISNEVFIHEQTHAKQKHTLDLLFVEVLKILFWFNPILNYYKKAITQNHEFLADEAVVRSGAEISDYQTLLLKTLIGHPQCSLSHSFSYPVTKKRLMMMIQPQSRTRTLLKTACLIPLFTAFAYLFGCEATTPDIQTNDNEIHIAFTDSELIVVNGETMAVPEFEEMLNTLPEDRDYQFVIEEHSDMLTGPVMSVNRIIHTYQLEDGYEPNYIAVIEIDDAGNIRLDGKEVLKDDLERALIEIIADHQPIINFRVHQDSDFQLILDVQTLLRKSGALRINYSTVRYHSQESNLKGHLDETVKKLNKRVQAYFELKNGDITQGELQEEYEKVMEIHNEVTKAQIELYRDSLMTPPAPPVPPAPESQIESNRESTSYESDSENNSYTLTGSLYQLKILMNHQGMLLINEEPSRMEDVRSVVKEFIDNHSRDETTVVLIKTDRYTPYDEYLQLMDEINTGYQAVWEDAARNKFNAPFSTLTNEQQTEIRTAYSKNIHVSSSPEST